MACQPLSQTDIGVAITAINLQQVLEQIQVQEATAAVILIGEPPRFKIDFEETCFETYHDSNQLLVGFAFDWEEVVAHEFKPFVYAYEQYEDANVELPVLSIADPEHIVVFLPVVPNEYLALAVDSSHTSPEELCVTALTITRSFRVSVPASDSRVALSCERFAVDSMTKLHVVAA